MGNRMGQVHGIIYLIPVLHREDMAGVASLDAGAGEEDVDVMAVGEDSLS